MKWADIEDMNGSASVLHCSARVLSYRIIVGDERRISDRAYHGLQNLREYNTVNLTIAVGKYKILANKDYIMSMSGFFNQILGNADRHSRHDDLLLNEPRDEAFVTLIDICHHKFWCKYELKDEVLELAKTYQVPLARDFLEAFFRSDRGLRENIETPPLDVDHEFSLAKAVYENTSHLLTRFPLTSS